MKLAEALVSLAMWWLADGDPMDAEARFALGHISELFTKSGWKYTDMTKEGMFTSNEDEATLCLLEAEYIKDHYATPIS